MPGRGGSRGDDTGAHGLQFSEASRFSVEPIESSASGKLEQTKRSKFMHRHWLHYAIALAMVFSLATAVTACGEEDEENDHTPTELTDEEFEMAEEIYFDLCAGCHGSLRGGATGPELTPERSMEMGTEALASITGSGTPGGMPGYNDVLSDDELDILARFLQKEPPSPPFNSMQDIADSAWATPPEELVDEPTHDHDIDDLLVVTLRDTGQNAVVDQSTQEIAAVVDTGYATHVTKFSTDGRFAVIMGRDGLVSKLDLYSLEIVGEATIAMDARDVAVSTYPGYEDEYIIGGAYWPPQAVILDFDTMMPERIINLQGVSTDGEYEPEARAAAMYATEYSPTFLVNAKETGIIWFIDYTDLDNLRVEKVRTEMFLHDGFFDQTGRYFMIAANERNKMQVVDTKERSFVAEIETGLVPHPGPGAVWETDEFGYVAGTTHLGEGKVTVWGTDHDHEEHLWEVVGEIEYATSGGLFLRTHENSNYVWFDSPMSTEQEEQGRIYLSEKEPPFEVQKEIQVTEEPGALVTHFEPNRDGTEMWVSVWDTTGIDSTNNALVVYDSQTAEEIGRMTNDEWPSLITPTGKFQSYLRAGK